ncbi:hypothetical protein BLA60_39355, partial [Actinophytocola xinjiangensis]
ERFDLDPTKKGRTYSKGNRQKVAIVAVDQRDSVGAAVPGAVVVDPADELAELGVGGAGALRLAGLVLEDTAALLCARWENRRGRSAGCRCAEAVVTPARPPAPATGPG